MLTAVLSLALVAVTPSGDDVADVDGVADGAALGTVVADPAGDDVVIPSTPPPPPPPAPSARLIYAPGTFADACPDADAVAALVKHHLGYDPFGEPAERVLLFALDGDEGGAKRARVELLDRNLEPLGSRVVESSAGCAELVATGALQMSIALDPLAVNVSPPTPTPAPALPPPEVTPAGPTAPPEPDADPAATPSPPTTTPPATTTTPPTATPLGPLPPPTVSILGIDNIGLFLGLGIHVAALLSPEGLMPGLTMGVGGRWQFVSARVEGRFDITDDRGTSTYPLLLTASPCLHLPLFSVDGDGDIEVSGCGTATAGLMPSFGAYNGVGVYAGAGMRVGLDWHIPGELTVRTFGQLEAAGLRPTFSTSTGSTFESPAFNMMLGAGFDLPDGTVW